ncbi:MAG: hypothetical protein ABIF12_02765 [bacterium]
MKFFNKVVKRMDKETDKIEKNSRFYFKRYFSIFSGCVLLGLLLFSIFKIYRTGPYFVTTVISQDIQMIVNALNEIDKECSILSIESDRNVIDFLTVVKFVGSGVGCLNLAYSENWTGPYIEINPTIKGRLYEIVKTKEGFFVVPGQGVKLPNKLRIGKDFQINFDSVISDMIKIGGPLNYEGKALAIKLELKVGDWPLPPSKIEEKIENINAMLTEFNQAMPFTQNENEGASV